MQIETVEALKVAAEKSKSGKWIIEVGSDYHRILCGKRWIAEMVEDENYSGDYIIPTVSEMESYADFIVTANPEIILELLSTLSATRRELEQSQSVNESLRKVIRSMREATKQREEIIATLKARESAEDAFGRGFRAAQRLAYISPWDEHLSGNPIAATLGSPAQCVDVHRGLILAQTVPPYIAPTAEEENNP